jgi:hypothetical protein
VIRESVFGVVRHPVYLSEILFYLGLLMLSLSLAYEEKLLLARFGKDYAKYKREVPMWLPQSSLPSFSQQCIPRIPENQKAKSAPGHHQFPGKIQPKQERSHFWG